MSNLTPSNLHSMPIQESAGLKKTCFWGAWVAQSARRPTSAQVMISQSVSSSPTSGSVLTAQSLEPASDSVSPSLSAPPLLMICLSKINKCLKIFLKKIKENCLFEILISTAISTENICEIKTY